jgi:hypothetical protein
MLGNSEWPREKQLQLSYKFVQLNVLIFGITIYRTHENKKEK